MAPSEESGPGVLVANPGHMPWFRPAAGALADAGLLGTYVAPFARARWWARGPLRARGAPDNVAPARARSAASGAELLAGAARRLASETGLRRSLADRRDRRVALCAQRLISDFDAALLGYGAACEAAATARSVGVPTAVEQALHHHDFLKEILLEELEACPPEYRGTMQLHRPSSSRKHRLDAEIAAADRVVTLSSFSRDTFVNAGIPREKVVVNPLATDVGRWSRVTRAQDARFRALFLGALTQRKGLSYAVEGFRRAEIADGELLLVGTPIGPGTPWAGARHVVHRPWLAEDRLPDLLARVDVLVLPSLVEGLARVIIEAMAAGIPAIVTPNTGGEDLVQDGVSGYVVPIRDPDAIAERLVALREDSGLRAEMSAAARRSAADFDWPDRGRRVVRLMRSLIDGDRR